MGLVELCKDRIVDFLSIEIFVGLVQEDVAYQIPWNNWNELIGELLQASTVIVVFTKLFKHV